MPSPFAQFVKRKAPTTSSLRALPFFHSVESVYAVDIFNTEKLKTHHCDVFNEPLIYFFYGRPAYKVGSNQGSCGPDLFYCPTVFILKNSSSLSAKRIYPFDTGAFKSHYKSHVPSQYGLDRFLLGTSKKLTKQIVSCFFGSNNDYLKGKSFLKVDDIPFHETEARAYLNILNTTGEIPFDDRAYTVELQIDSDFDLGKCVEAVVAPSEVFDSPEIYNTVVNKWKAVPLDYMTYHCGDIGTFHGQVFEIVRSYMKTKGYIKP